MMKKNIFKISPVTAIAATAGYGVYESEAGNDVGCDAGECRGIGRAGDPCYKGPYNSALPEAVKCAQPCKKEKKGVVEQLINAIDY